MHRPRPWWLLLLFVALLFGCQPTPERVDTLVINEIMVNPAAVPDEQGEWIEVYNPTDHDIDLTGWTLSTASGHRHTISSEKPLIVHGHGFLVLGRNTDVASNGGVPVAYAYQGLTLRNGGDALILLDPQGREIDRVAYGAEAGLPAPEGTSLELIDPTLDNGAAENWCAATTPLRGGDRGTPAQANDCLAAVASPTPRANVIPIPEIQRTGDPNGDSPYAGRMVVTEGVVTGVFDDGARVFIQDPAGGPWSGLFLFRPSERLQVGDWVRVTGEVSEFKGLTEIAHGQVTVRGSGNPLPDPVVVRTGEAGQEQWESVLLRVEDVVVVDPDLGFGEWSVDDGSGPLRVDDLGDISYRPERGERLGFVVGPLYYSFGHFKLAPRTDVDIDFTPVPPTQVTPCQIQGDGPLSPLEGNVVETRGIVTADLEKTPKRGFFLQQPGCDADPTTSDGLFVYDRGRDLVSAGDEVVVRGQVKEFHDLTELVLEQVEVASHGNPLPTPVVLDPPSDATESAHYFEAREGMLVRVPAAQVVGPTNRFGEFAVVTADVPLEGKHVFRDGPVGEIFLVDDAGVGPFQLKVGDALTGLVGVVDYAFGAYKLQLVQEPTVAKAPDPGKRGDVDGDGDVDPDDRAALEARLGTVAGPEDPADLNGDLQITEADLQAWDALYANLRLPPDVFSVATFNTENLFDDVKDPGKLQSPDASSLLTAQEYARKLNKVAQAIHDDLREPTILGVQEVEKIEVLKALAAQPVIQTDYGAVLIEGPDGRGIDVGLLYDRKRVTVLSAEQRQGCTTLSPRSGGPGIPCDSNGDGTEDGNLLFSRPPLVVRLLVKRADGGEGRVLWLIVSHFKSKRGGEELTEARRVAQARFVAGLVREIQASAPGADVIVLGDLNDGLGTRPIQALTQEAELIDLWSQAPRPTRYSFIFNGVAEALDHILVTPGLAERLLRLEPVHINADFPEAWSQVGGVSRRSSDHDAVLAVFGVGE